MKNEPIVPPIVQPMIEELTGKQQPKPETTQPNNSPKPSELDQDSGGGFNRDHTYPQE